MYRIWRINAIYVLFIIHPDRVDKIKKGLTVTGIINIEDYIEHEDGSATITFECDLKTRELLTGLGLVSLLEKAINEEEGYKISDGEKNED